MLKKHSLRVSLEKTPSTKPTQSNWPTFYPDEVYPLIRDTTKLLALTAGAAYVTKRVIDTASEIALIAAKAKIG